MATLVLTAVGNIVGGPIGAAIGAMIGQQVDRSWLAPTIKREGPRLKELEVQTSSYGTPVSAIFGAMRVAGTVIWSTDLIERSTTQGGGKGRPSMVEYGYSVSLAVALSSRPIERVGRIWADGNLLRGAAGDLKYETGFRFHSGHADQLPDPLIASAETDGQCPAMRGISYAVFEDLQLAPFGNRIPQFTFEIFEREGAVPVREIFQSIASVSGDAGTSVIGYAVNGDNGRAALAPLLEVMPIMLRSNFGELELFDWPDPDATITVEPTGWVAGRRVEAPRQLIGAMNEISESVSLRHYDPARDYQLGIQRSGSDVRTGNGRQIDFPAALSAESAHALADAQYRDGRCARHGWHAYASMGAHRLRPGDWIEPQQGRRYRIESIEHSRGHMRIEARSTLEAIPGVSAAIPGRHIAAPDHALGETRLILADLPAIGTDPGRPLVAAFAAGSDVGWRRAQLSLRDGDGLIDMGSTAVPAIMGYSDVLLGPGSTHLVDDGGDLVVQLLHGGMDLPPGTGSPLDASAPLCLLGGEYMRYGSATALGDNRYRLRHLHRALFSNGPATEHEVSEAFLLVTREAAREIEMAAAVAGTVIEVEAIGIVDEEPTAATITLQCRATTPFAPVHGRISHSAEGLAVEWKWRSRVDFGWHDGVDQPCIEERLVFAIEIGTGSTVLERRETDSTALIVAQTDLDAWLPAGGPLWMEIRQIGRHARSRPLTLSTTL